jgi:ADP-ribose pyrophosphatase YjhB (NUDIX family)
MRAGGAATPPTTSTTNRNSYSPSHKSTRTFVRESAPRNNVNPPNPPNPPIFPYKSEGVDCTFENSRYWSPEEKKQWMEDHKDSKSRCQTVVYYGDSVDDCKVLMIRSKECLLEKAINQQLQIIGFPKGHVKKTNDTMKTCAFRELKEETCLDLNSLTQGIDYTILDIGRHASENTIYVKLLSDKARDMAGIDKCEDARNEVSEVLWLQLKDVDNAMDKNPWQFNKKSKSAVKQLIQSFQRRGAGAPTAVG